MFEHRSHQVRYIRFTLAAILGVSTLGSGPATSQFGILEIINETGGCPATFPNHQRRKQK